MLTEKKIQVENLLIASSILYACDFPPIVAESGRVINSARVSLQMYARLRDKTTPNNWSFDQCIQVGVDNMGSPTSETVGLVAGDEESFEVCYLVCHWLKSNYVVLFVIG